MYRQSFRRNSLVFKGFLRNLSKKDGKVNIHRSSVIYGIMKDKSQITSKLTQKFTIYFFSFTNYLELCNVFQFDQKGYP